MLVSVDWIVLLKRGVHGYVFAHQALDPNMDPISTTNLLQIVVAPPQMFVQLVGIEFKYPIAISFHSKTKYTTNITCLLICCLQSFGWTILHPNLITMH